MSELIKVSGSTLNEQAAKPDLRSFQVDSLGLGAITECVNLFRGDVTLPIELYSTETRSGQKITVSMVYQSNLHRAVDTWNLDAPTGPLGLGWSMGFDFIAIDIKANTAPGDNQFFLVAEGASNRLFKVGETTDYWEFQADQFKFWRIRFYFARNSFEIVKEDGTIYVYGGSDGSNPETAPVQMGVKWGGPQGSWVGSSGQTVGQAEYTVAWNLAHIQSTWGDRILFEYQNEVDPVSGPTGLPYTRSSRLKRVVDPTGRTITYVYKDKVYDNAAHEYQPPHVGPVTAYQDRYETRSLDRVEVTQSTSGTLLTRLDFNYALRNASLDHQGDPNFVKRYLTGVTIRTGDGLALPNFGFDYYTDPGDLTEDTHRGVLKSVLYPQGGRIRYDFTAQNLPGTDRQGQLPRQGVPRVWFGPDYSISTNYDGAASGLKVQLYRWDGLWIEDPQSYQLKEEIDLETLEVSTQPDFCALSFQSGSSNRSLSVLLFHKEKGRYGRWIKDQAFTRVPVGGGGQGLIATGENFAVALASGGNVMARVWDPANETWIDRSSSLRPDAGAQYALDALGSYTCLAQYSSQDSSVSLSMFALDNLTRDFVGVRLQTSSLSGVTWDNDTSPDTFWALGVNFAVSTYATQVSKDGIRYSIVIQQWDELYNARQTFRKDYSLPGDAKMPFSHSIASGSVVGNLNNLLRFDGNRWIEGSLPLDERADPAPRFLYGSDFAIIASDLDSVAAQFDPYLSQWITLERTSGSGADIIPSINGNYVTRGRTVYYRNSADKMVPIFDLDTNIKSESLVNRAPQFLAYEDTSGNTYVLPLRNGQVANDQKITLPNQRIYVDAKGASGTQLAGPSSLVTYEGSSFEGASRINIYQFVNEGLTGPVRANLVTGVNIDDGYPDAWGQQHGASAKTTRYYYSGDQVSVTPDGSVTQFAAATTVYGAPSSVSGGLYPPPAETPHGSTEARYHNNRSPRESGLVANDAAAGDMERYYSYLAGQIFDKTDYDATGGMIQRDTSLYEVRTEYEPLDVPGTRQPMYGALVLTSGIHATQYEEATPVGLSGISEAMGSQEDLPRTLQAGITRAQTRQGVAATLVGGHPRTLRYYPDERHHYVVPLVERAGQLMAAYGVARDIRYEYSWSTGLRTAEETDTYNSEGKAQTLRSEIYYAFEVSAYVVLKDRHMLSPVALSLKGTTAGKSGDPLTPTALSITTYKEFFDTSDVTVNKWSSCRTYAALTGDVYDPGKAIPVIFDDWGNDKAAVNGWRLLGEAQKRNENGPVLATSDTMGNVQNYLMDSEARFRVCDFSNTAPDEATYTGFESYESLEGWVLDGMKLVEAIVTGDAHTGEAALSLAAQGKATLSTTRRLRPGRSYVLSFWVKTAPNFEENKAVWAVTQAGTPLAQLPVKASTGGWSFRHLPFTVPGAGDPVEVRCAVTNESGAAGAVCLLDDIFVVALDSSATASVFHSDTLDVMANVEPTGSTSLQILDAYRRAVGETVTSDGDVDRLTVTSAQLPYQVRQIEREADGFVFPQDDPNADHIVTAAEGGIWADLINGSDWAKQWVTDAPSAWTVRGGRLMHEGTAADNIRFAAGGSDKDAGGRLSIHLPTDADGLPVLPAHPVAMRLGDAIEMRWTPESGWAVRVAGDNVTLTRPMSVFANDLAILVPYDAVADLTTAMVFADGRLIYAGRSQGALSGTLEIECADVGITFSGIATLRAPRLKATYVDGSGKERQNQSFDGTGIIVAQSVYDPIGRAALGIKPTRLADRAIGYIADFVETFDPISGVLTGLAADSNPDDQGFPYWRTEFFPTAQLLSKKQGAPGHDFAIRQTGPLGQEQDENPHISSFLYGTNTQGDFGIQIWPANQYFVTLTTDPDGDNTWRITTKTGEQVAEVAGPMTPNGDDYRITQVFYDSNGQVLKTLPPEAVAAAIAGDDSKAEKLSTTATYSFVGEQITRVTPDSGEVQFVYDPLGRLRFVMDAEGADPTRSVNRILYTKFDTLGRSVEEGYIDMNFDRAALEAHAATDPGWPDSSQPHTVRLRKRYDGDGQKAELIGQLVQTESFAPGDQSDVVETFDYDWTGNTTSLTTKAQAFDATERSIRFGYNALGERRLVLYPDGAAFPEIVYEFNRLGQIARVGTPDAPDAFGTHRYDALGNVQDSVLGAKTAAPIVQTAGFAPPGWPLGSQNRLAAGGIVLDESLSYTSGGYDGEAYYTGKIASAHYADDVGSYAYRYRYDVISELATGENTEDDGASVGVSSPIAYDLNGNIQTLPRGSGTLDYTYSGDSNTLTSIAGTSEGDENFASTLNGAVKARTSEGATAERPDLKSIDYDPNMGLATRIDVGTSNNDTSGHVTFSYDATARRVVKNFLDKAQQEQSAALYLRGGALQTLYESRRSRADGAQDTQFVYGPNGLTALHRGAKTYRVIRDRLGSVRRVVDETGATVARYDYTPFGIRIVREEPGQEDICLYRFTGQELDPETGLYNFHARFYDPVAGRFYGVDPKDQFASPFAYAGNNPVNFIDLDGEEFLTAFLVAVIVSAIIGVVAGLVTYAVTYQGSFDVGKFFLYGLVGGVAGAAGGAIGYGVGVLATGALAAAGVATSTSIASGVVVGAASGAADGVIAGTLNQVGVNLIEGRDPGEGVGMAAAMGAGIGLVVGGALGGVTGKLNQGTARRLAGRPDRMVTERGADYAAHVGVPNTYPGSQLGQAISDTTAGEILAFGGHGSRLRGTINFGPTGRLTGRQIVANHPNFNGDGISLPRVCWSGRNGVAQDLASGYRVPVRGSTAPTRGNGIVSRRWKDGAGLYVNLLRRFGRFRTFYPNKYQTAWVSLFGY
ncbi:MAG: RHS repeat-associated core domain-containing protein [Acidihalobacter sp.]